MLGMKFQIKQCRLRQDGRLWIIGKSHFDGLTKLIEYYKKYPLYCTRNNQQIKLTEPVKKIPVDDVSCEISTFLQAISVLIMVLLYIFKLT